MAKTSGGIRGGNNSFAGNWASTISNPIMRAEAQNAARLLLALGVPPSFLPEIEEKFIKSTKTGVTVAAFREGIEGVTSDLIRVNTDNIAIRMTEKYAAGAVKGGWYTQSNPILHELSHKIHSQLSRELQRTPRWREATRGFSLDKDTIKKTVSGYAATNNAEYHAEIISGIISGRKYPKTVLDDTILSRSDNPLAKKLYRKGLRR